MKLIREKEDIVLKNDNTEIERYNLSQEITFKGYISFLIGLNLSEKIEIKDEINDKNEAECNLIKLINEIKDDYNVKVDELSTFKKEIEK